MKTVIYLIIIIGWGVLQARRKAMREQKRRQTQQDASPQSVSTQSTSSPIAERIRARQPAPLGAVSAEENQFMPIERADRSRIAPTISEELRKVVESTRRSKQKKQKEAQENQEAAQAERVEEIVSPASSEAAYEITTAVRRRIAFDKDALRTFIVTREVLGPPRFRNPHRPGLRGR
jgi:hypothetical protein